MVDPITICAAKSEKQKQNKNKTKQNKTKQNKKDLTISRNKY